MLHHDRIMTAAGRKTPDSVFVLVSSFKKSLTESWLGRRFCFSQDNFIYSCLVWFFGPWGSLTALNHFRYRRQTIPGHFQTSTPMWPCYWYSGNLCWQDRNLQPLKSMKYQNMLPLSLQWTVSRDIIQSDSELETFPQTSHIKIIQIQSSKSF